MKNGYQKIGLIFVSCFILVMLTSCEFDDTGDLYITDTGWLFIVVFIVVFIFVLIKGNIENEKEKNFNAYIEEQRRKDELERQEKEETKRIENETVFKSIAEEYKAYFSMDIDVKGIYYRTKLAKETIESLTVHDEIKLRKEPTNKYDPYAVKVMYERIHLGYVPANVSKRITELIDNKVIKKIVVKYAGDAKLYPWDESDPYLTLTIYYDGIISDELKEKYPHLKEIE